MDFPQILMDFQSISVVFNHFQSVSVTSVIFNHFQPFSITFSHFHSVKWKEKNTQECIDNRKVGEDNT